MPTAARDRRAFFLRVRVRRRMVRDGNKSVSRALPISASHERLLCHALFSRLVPSAKWPANSVPAVLCCVGAANASGSTVGAYASGVPRAPRPWTPARRQQRRRHRKGHTHARERTPHTGCSHMSASGMPTHAHQRTPSTVCRSSLWVLRIRAESDLGRRAHQCDRLLGGV
jgi:hypothetical protein